MPYLLYSRLLPYPLYFRLLPSPFHHSPLERMGRKRTREQKASARNGLPLTPADIQEAQKPWIHFGRIASGDVVMKSGIHRDQIALKEKVIAFEMEGAGVRDNFPTVVMTMQTIISQRNGNSTPLRLRLLV